MAGRHGRIGLISGTLAAFLAGAALPSSAQTPPSFAPAVSFAAGALPITVGIADVNGDGKPDLVTVNTGANTVSVLLGNGAGSFGPRTDFATDRKSTRLNSSHGYISYAVFCLKKKKQRKKIKDTQDR